MKVTFRVDASLTIGSGHVMRCLTLANALRQRGHDCTFVCVQHAGNMINAINMAGFQVHTLAARHSQNKHNEQELNSYAQWLGCTQYEDAKQTKTILALNNQSSLMSERMKPDWLVVDSYALNQEWQRPFSALGIKIFVIDDLADRLHQCDLLLDQTFGRAALDYRHLVPVKSEILAGVDYCLLRPEFLQHRRIDNDVSRTGQRGKHKYQILITLGGIDEHNVTERILTIFNQLSLPDTHFVVVLGANSPWQQRIKTLTVKLDIEITVHVGVSNMAALMSECDFAIGAAGSTTWERCCVGLPSALIAIADNQEFALSVLAHEGIVAKFDLGTLEEDIKSFFYDKNKDEIILALTTHCKRLVDGAGCMRVVDKMENMHAL